MLPEFFRLPGKVAMVTGAGNPLAKAIGEAFAEAGADVVAVSHRAEAAQALATAVRGHGRQSLAVTADMTHAADVHRVTGQVLGRFGKVDILLTGEEAIFAAPVGDLEEEQWDTLMSVNAKSVYLCAQTVGKEMLTKGQGRIIVLAHGLGLVGVPNTTAYSASQGAVLQFTKCLGVEWAATGVTVNAIATGWFEGSWETPGGDPLAHFIPMRRRGRPEELGPVAVYLASDAAKYVTAATYIVDGGQICHA